MNKQRKIIGILLFLIPVIITCVFMFINEIYNKILFPVFDKDMINIILYSNTQTRLGYITTPFYRFEIMQVLYWIYFSFLLIPFAIVGVVDFILFLLKVKNKKIYISISLIVSTITSMILVINFYINVVDMKYFYNKLVYGVITTNTQKNPTTKYLIGLNQPQNKDMYLMTTISDTVLDNLKCNSDIQYESKNKTFAGLMKKDVVLKVNGAFTPNMKNIPISKGDVINFKFNYSKNIQSCNLEFLSVTNSNGKTISIPELYSEVESQANLTLFTKNLTTEQRNFANLSYATSRLNQEECDYIHSLETK